MADKRTKRRARSDLAKLRGIPPYDGGSNSVREDGYFSNSLVSRYSMEISELVKWSGFDAMYDDWLAHRRRFLKKWTINKTVPSATPDGAPYNVVEVK